MKIKVESTDRIGISQEILAIFASKSWNLKSIEVEAHFTFVHIERVHVSLAEVEQSLRHIDGFLGCEEIVQMPAEQRENHLHTLLNRIPDPILDIDEQGIILASNSAADSLLQNDKQSLVDQPITHYIDVPLSQLLQLNEISLSVNFIHQPFIADINPVVSEQKISGAVVSLRSMHKVGRQLSLMQSSPHDALQSIIGHSKKIKLVLSQVQRFAELDLPVLICGDTGTGKELIARALHQLSERKEAPFLTINCAALPEHLLESELFGYESGAFTGASKGGKPGLFELAQGGSVFLDEIAEMSPYLQAKLLRFLQDFKYRKVGGTKEFTADVKIISASHQHFNELIEQQKFREDLYYRLNVLRLELPALKDRAEDITLLVEHFVLNAARQFKLTPPSVSHEAMTILTTFHWPGNIRQLENVIFRLIALNEGSKISAAQVQTVLFDSNDPGLLTTMNEQEIEDWASAQANFERRLLEQLYPYYPTTRKLAERLKVSHNKIAMKLRAYGIK
ncbi:transcriptional regulator [Thalassotalea insulae]|uniref:HTH-type transcriptional regulatory protein TyrR n=1 Tax=Thalassotalea insulae TaxID=2056778 RepID=A0ABQ6GZG1_9GAMM|nr:sigma 54-interacting transcriptional regulator [Thalassotalea insulae]GLX79885.1 transcriptional regulator [Thalassotalea insulae]